MDNNLTYFMNSFTNISKKPHEFLSVQEKSAEKIKDLIKELYDFTKNNESQSYKNTLPELIVENFDEEQIWQELELQNSCCTINNIETVSELTVKKDKLCFPLKLKCLKSDEEKSDIGLVSDGKDLKNVEDIDADESENEDDDILAEDDDSFDEEASNMSNASLSESDNEENQKKGKQKSSIVDDQFFKLADLEVFLKNEDKSEDKPRKDNDSFDLFGKIDSEGAEYKYSDFFENPEGVLNDDENMEFEGEDGDKEDDVEDNYDDDNESEDDESALTTKKNNTKRKHTDVESENKEEKGDKKKVRFSLLDSDEEDSNANPKDLFCSSKKEKKKSDEVKSSLEQRQERLGRVINRLEEQALTEKPWQLRGEITAGLRPENSLLEETVDFDLSVRPAPVMTEEVTLKLEDIIMQRIKDKAWDDVERKVKPVETPSEFKKKLALDQEKSKLSLAEVYEKEYIKQREAATTDDTERQEAEPALHIEVRSMLQSLFNKLDALSNYHYTPRPVAPEMKVISNVAAISMEEVAPVTVSDAALLAPQEVKGKKLRGVPMSKDERTETDKKRARRLKKTKQRQRQREKEKTSKEVAKINPGLGNKYSKLSAEKKLLDVSGSNIIKMDEKQDKAVRSSTAFFNKLQDEVKTQIKSKTSFVKKKDKRNVTAKKLKL